MWAALVLVTVELSLVGYIILVHGDQSLKEAWTSVVAPVNAVIFAVPDFIDTLMETLNSTLAAR